QQERCGPLAKKERGVVLALQLGDERSDHGGTGGAKVEAGGQLSRIALDQRSYLILFDVACAYSIIRHAKCLLGPRSRLESSAALTKEDARAVREVNRRSGFFPYRAKEFVPSGR